MDKQRTIDVLKRATRATATIGLAWTVLRQETDGADAVIQLQYGGIEVELLAEVKTNLRPPMVGAIQHQLERLPGKALLVADHVTPAIAAELRKRKIQFIDTLGNAYLDQPPLLVWIVGQKAETPAPESKERDRAFLPTGLRVVFALLCQPDAVAKPYRDIAEMADVAHGTVGWVMPDLMRLGFVIEIGHHRRLVERERLLVRWAQEYATRLRPKLQMARYRAEALDWTEKVVPQDYAYLLGGEPAAQRMTAHLRPGTATFYGERVNTKMVIDHRLRPDPAGNVEILQRFWNFATPVPGMTPPILVYADLLAIGDARCVEVAKELYPEVLDRLKH